jgi:hypothetical protein
LLRPTKKWDRYRRSDEGGVTDGSGMPIAVAAGLTPVAALAQTTIKFIAWNFQVETVQEFVKQFEAGTAMPTTRSLATGPQSGDDRIDTHVLATLGSVKKYRPDIWEAVMKSAQHMRGGPSLCRVQSMN